MRHVLLLIFATIGLCSNALAANDKDSPNTINIEHGENPGKDVRYGIYLDKGDEIDLNADDSDKDPFIILEDDPALRSGLIKPNPNSADLSNVDPKTICDDDANAVCQWHASNLKREVPEIHLEDGQRLEFETKGFKIRIGLNRILTFTVKDPKTNELYTAIIGPTAHNILLRAALFRKLGYWIDPVKHLKSINLKFQSAAYKRVNFVNEFIDIVKDDGLARWGIDPLDENAEIVLNDVIIKKGILPDLYPLEVASEVIPTLTENNRFMRATLIPYSLVDVPESANVFNWRLGRIHNDEIELPYKNAGLFRCTYDDARWISRKILDLSEDDLWEVVQFGQFPEEVAALLYEKIKSRRNDLIKLFNFPQYSPHSVDSTVSLGENLKKGRIEKYDWDKEGYATRFNTGEPENPLTKDGELLWLAASKIKSAGLGRALKFVSNDVLPQNTHEDAFKKRQKKLQQKAFDELLEEGKPNKIKFKPFFFPVYSFSLIGNRDIIFGAFEGFNNRVQLIDSFGFGATKGIGFGTQGNPTGWQFWGSLFTQSAITWSHVKPLKSIKTGFKENPVNIIVPRFALKATKLLRDIKLNSSPKVVDGIPVSNEDGGNVVPEAKKSIRKQAIDALQYFKKNFHVGESIVVQKSLLKHADVNAAFEITSHLSASITAEKNARTLWRTHVHRRDANTVQIYKDYGTSGRNIRDGRITARLSAFGKSFLEISGARDSGKGEVELYTISLDPPKSDAEVNEDFIRKIRALKNAMTIGSTKELRRLGQEPTEVNTKFVDKTARFKFLFFNKHRLSGEEKIKVKFSNGDKMKYYRLRKSYLSSFDPLTFGLDVLSVVSDELLEIDLDIDLRNGSDPGSNPGGSSTRKSVEYHGIIETFTGDPKLAEHYVRLSETHSGFLISQKKLKKKLAKIENSNSDALFPTEVFIDSDQQDIGWRDRDRSQLSRISKGDIRASESLNPYHKDLFGENFFFDEKQFSQTKKVFLYNVTVSYNISRHGIAALLEKNVDDLLKRIGKKMVDPVTGEDLLKKCSFKKASTPEIMYVNRHVTGSNRPAKLISKCSYYHMVVHGLPKLQKKIDSSNFKKVAEGAMDVLDGMKGLMTLREIENELGKDSVFVLSSISGFRSGDHDRMPTLMGNTFGRNGSRFPTGPIDHAKQLTKMLDGEFHMYWMRSRY